MRSRRYTPSPPRGYEIRGRSPSPRGRCGGRGRDMPTSLLVRNLRHDCRAEDLRGPFCQFGPLKDIYLPRDYYTGERRGFGFVQHFDRVDAAEAKYHMDGQILLGRELTVVFAEENRKRPSEMKARERRDRSYNYQRSPRRLYSRYSHSRSRSPRYSRSSPRGVRSRSRSHHSYNSSSPRQRSFSPRNRSSYRERSYSQSPASSRSSSRSAEDYPTEPMGSERRSLSVSD